MSVAAVFNNRAMTGVGRFFESLVAGGALVVLILAVFAAAVAPLLAPQNPYDLAQLNVMDASLPPGSRGGNGALYLLGTDDQGRDLVSAILYGLRTSLIVALVSGAIAMAVGSAAGITAAYYGGWVDSLLMRIVDVQLAFPSILVALVLLAVFGAGLDKVILGIVAAQWAIYARTVRGAGQVERRKEYIAAAHVLVFRPWRIMLRHMMPNSVSDLGVVATAGGGRGAALRELQLPILFRAARLLSRAAQSRIADFRRYRPCLAAPRA